MKTYERLVGSKDFDNDVNFLLSLGYSMERVLELMSDEKVVQFIDILRNYHKYINKNNESEIKHHL